VLEWVPGGRTFANLKPLGENVRPLTKSPAEAVSTRPACNCAEGAPVPPSEDVDQRTARGRGEISMRAYARVARRFDLLIWRSFERD